MCCTLSGYFLTYRIPSVHLPAQLLPLTLVFTLRGSGSFAGSCLHVRVVRVPFILHSTAIDPFKRHWALTRSAQTSGLAIGRKLTSPTAMNETAKFIFKHSLKLN